MLPIKRKAAPLLNRLSQSRYKQSQSDTTKILHCIQLLSERINTLCNVQQKMMSSAAPPISSHKIQRVQQRFQRVFSPIPQLPPLSNLQKQNQQRTHLIEVWLGKACQQVFSVTFSMFQTQKLNQRKAKAYCCQNMLSNIIKMIRQNNLTAQQISIIDECLKNQLIPYFLIKYPMSQQAEVNEQFNNKIVQTDSMENNQNDFVFRSKIQFNYHSDGNYNRQIMRLINYIIELPSMKLQQNGQTLFKNFYNDMQSFFKKIENQKFTLQNTKPDFKHILMRAFSLQQKKVFPDQKFHKTTLQQEKQKQKYRQNVKSYTKRLIGRKISQNIKPFTENQIKDNELTLKNPSIMRIVTKWCVQLMQNFDTYYKILNKQEQFRMKDGSQKILKRKHLLILSELLKRQKKKVDDYLAKVNKNNSQCQFDFGSSKIPNNMQKFSEEQSQVGLFAAEVINNYQIYLVGYVNTIIHALMSATKDYEEMVKAYEYKQDQFGQYITKWRIGQMNFQDLVNRAYSYRLSNVPVSYKSLVPQLVSFRVGDILRCRCTSNQKQIIALYNELEYISRKQNTQMKIVRMKNRLAKGTKDILINLMYRNTMLIQMQLAITTNRSKFIDFSNKYNHVLYQLSRAQFGPLSQMCNIWINNDIKAQFYVNQARILNSRKQNNQRQDHLCKGDSIQFPFRCSQCSYFYNDCQYILKHIECKQKNCQKKICSLCRAQKFDYMTMKKKFVEIPSMQILGMKQNENFLQYRKRSGIQNGKSNQFLQGPQKFGMLIDLKSEEQKPIFYINVKIRRRNIIVQIKNIQKLQFNVMKQINTKQQMRIFKKQYLIFTSKKLTQMLEVVKTGENLNRFMTQYNFPKLLQKWKAKEKSTIVFMEGDLKDEDMSKIAQKFYFTKKVNFYQNKLTDFHLLLSKFDHCQIVDLGYNQVQTLSTNLEQQKHFHNLKVLYLNYNRLSQIDQNFAQIFKNIQQLQLANNKIKDLPKNFGQLQKIKILNLSRNQLEHVPQEITKLTTLRVLNLYAAKFYQKKLLDLPQSLGNLINLKKININFNKITKLPNSIGQLTKLQILYAASNQLKQLPNTISNLTQLKILNLAENQFTNIPQQIGNLTNLQILNLQNSSPTQLPVKKLPNIYCNLINMKMMDISQNKLTELPQNIGNCSLIQTFFIYQNKLKQIPQSIGKLKSLHLLYASNNQFKFLPDSICNLQNLQKLTIKQNKIQALPQNIGKLKLKYLFCQGNNIKNLPNSIGDLQQLKQLLIHQNNINSLPQSFIKLKQLLRINIDFDKLDNPSKKILNSMKLTQKI